MSAKNMGMVSVLLGVTVALGCAAPGGWAINGPGNTGASGGGVTPCQMLEQTLGDLEHAIIDIATQDVDSEAWAIMLENDVSPYFAIRFLQQETQKVKDLKEANNCPDGTSTD